MKAPKRIEAYSPKAAAEFFGVEVSTIRAAIASGELPAVKYNQRVFRISATDAAIWYASKGGRLRSTTCTTTTTPCSDDLQSDQRGGHDDGHGSD